MTDDVQWTNYNKWSANTTLTLVNVPWNNDYRDIVGYTHSQYDAWIDQQQTAVIRKFSTAKFERDVVVDTPINAAMRYNYLRAANPVQPVPGDVARNFYYFILGVDYLGPKSTRLRLQLDVWATYGPDVQFGRCMVVQGHIGIANENQFSEYGRQYLTVPENLDVGNEYRIVHKERTQVMDVAGLVNAEPGYDILVCSTLDLTQAPGTIDDPGFETSTGGNWNGIPSGADFYLFKSGEDLQKFFVKYSGFPWITQSILSITIIPNMSRYAPGYDYGSDLSTDSNFSFYKATRPFFSNPPTPKTVANLSNWRNNAFIAHVLGDAFAGLKKFFTFPYMVIELTSHNGSPVLLRPEAWQDADAKVTELAAFMPPGQRIVMYPARYNADAETLTSTQTDNLTVHGGTDLIDDNGESVDIAVTIDNFPSLPIVNNMGIAYLAQNAHGLAFSFQNAGWGQTRAIAAGQAGADVANAQMGNTARQAGIGNTAVGAQAALQNNIAAGQGIVGVVESAAQANPVGMIGATASALLRQQSVLGSAGIQQDARSQSAGSDIQTAGQVRDTNQAFANFAAGGDYQQAVAGIHARMQDAQLTQPSVSGQFGGDAFNLVQGMSGYVLTWKMLNLQALRQIGYYWLRYGYAVHQYMQVPVLQCMSKFTYWKMTETYIKTAPIPEGFKMIIRGIFEHGVTVWNNPDDINTALLSDNQPLDGFSF